MTRLLIIGGGASGMTAALTALDSPDIQVTLLERQARLGRKLLTTGNGRCNLTNRTASPARYHGEDKGFCRAALERFPVEDTLAWFARMGLETVTEPGGRVYPRSNSANSVLDVLRAALAQQERLTLLTGTAAADIRHKNGVFTCKMEDGQVLQADKVILAAGGAAGSKVGGVMDGYRLGKALGHHRTALLPSLVQIRTEPTYPRALKGVKADASVALRRQDKVLASTEGEVLFTEYGVSGPAIFDISRCAAEVGDGGRLTLDLWREKSGEDVLIWLRRRCAERGALPSDQVFTGALHNRLGQMVVKYADVPKREHCADFTDDELQLLAAACKVFTLPVTGVCGFDQAQVTAGGLRTDEFDPQTLQSRVVPGFYACGEVLDVDGDCGGFNLQWAWSSARLAGLLL